MKQEWDAMQAEAREKAVWTAPVLKKGAVGNETALMFTAGDDGIIGSS